MRTAALLVTLLAVAVALPGIGNDFTYDDVPMVRDNARVHTLGSPLAYLGQSYWPPYHSGALHRPVTVQLFALQWAAGNGNPLVFHMVSIAAYAAVTLALFWLASLVLPVGPAFWAAALFAVHPVHVEAVAGVVGQSELYCTLLSIGAVALYIKLRRGTAGPGARLGLLGLVALAALSKEQGFVVPALLLLAEFTVVAPQGSPRARKRAMVEAIVPAVFVLLCILALRLAVLGGLGGGAPAFGMRGLGIEGRTLTFLTLVPSWFRLLVWPAHLRISYSPPEFTAATTLGATGLAGLALLVAIIGVAWWARRGAPVITLGLGWAIIAIAPVSNLLFATGVIIAERTLFLPSVGVVLAVAATWHWLAGRAPGWTALRRLGPVAAAALVAIGGIRSARRQVVWRDDLTLQHQAVADSPRGYRAHYTLGITLNGQGRLVEAEQHFLQAAGLYGSDPRVFEELSHIVRRLRGCPDAMQFMRKALAADSSLTVSRSRLYFCQLEAGDVVSARETALAGEQLGLREFVPLRTRADSLLARHPAPRH